MQININNYQSTLCSRLANITVRGYYLEIFSSGVVRNPFSLHHQSFQTLPTHFYILTTIIQQKKKKNSQIIAHSFFLVFFLSVVRLIPAEAFHPIRKTGSRQVFWYVFLISLFLQIEALFLATVVSFCSIGYIIVDAIDNSWACFVV